MFIEWPKKTFFPRQGDMCRTCLEDADVGRLFTQGPNPVVLRRVIRVPDKMAVTDAMMEPLMERELSFTQEMQVSCSECGVSFTQEMQVRAF